VPITDKTGRRAGDLTLDVYPHPEAARRAADDDATYLQAELEGKITVPVHRDYNAGDRLLVTIAGDDGEIIGRRYLEVGRVTFEPIVERNLGVIGTTRVHKATQVE
jgi:hypothetical protein